MQVIVGAYNMTLDEIRVIHVSVQQAQSDVQQCEAQLAGLERQLAQAHRDLQAAQSAHDEATNRAKLLATIPTTPTAMPEGFSPTRHRMSVIDYELVQEEDGEDTERSNHDDIDVNTSTTEF